jgi:tetracycline repressor-like protein
MAAMSVLGRRQRDEHHCGVQDRHQMSRGNHHQRPPATLLPGRGARGIAALRRHRPMLSGEVPDTGSLRGDVLDLLRRMSARLAEIGPETVYGLLGDYFGDAELFSRIQEQVLHIGAGVMTTILKRAAGRGEARADIRPVIATLPTDLFRHQLLLTRTPPSEGIIAEIVDDVFLPLVRP